MTSNKSEQETRLIRENSFGWMFKSVCTNLDESIGKSLNPLGINLPQFTILMVLSEKNSLTQTEIGQFSSQPGYAITRNLDALEKRGFVRRQPHKTSRRSHCVSLTPAGKAITPELFAIVKKINSNLLAGLNTDEEKQLGALLGKLLDTHTL